MRTLAAALCAVALGLMLSDRPVPVTAQEKAVVVKWEYAEMAYRSTSGRPAIKDKDGNEQPAIQPTVTIRWTTGTEEVSVKGWDELGEKLKVQVKKDTSASLQKLQILNALGAAGWELVSQESATPAAPTGAVVGGPGFGRNPGTTTTWLFKRRVQ